MAVAGHIGAYSISHWRKKKKEKVLGHTFFADTNFKQRGPIVLCECVSVCVQHKPNVI